MTGGGVNWGGVAFDSVNQILYANVSAAVNIVKLIPADQTEGMKSGGGRDFGPQRGAAFAMVRTIATTKMGLLCNPPPWGSLVAVDLKAGKIRWRSSVGTTEDKAPLGMAFHWGSPLLNGVLVTAGRLVFTGALDAYLRAFDAAERCRTLAGPIAGTGRRQSDDLHLERRTICRHCRRRSFGSRIVDRRQHCRVSSGAQRGNSVAVVTHDRSAGRSPLGNGHRGDFVLAFAVTCALVWRARRRRSNSRFSLNNAQYPRV